MLKSCRRRGPLFCLQHRGCKILLFVGTAQFLCTVMIYYLIGIDDQPLDQTQQGLPLQSKVQFEPVGQHALGFRQVTSQSQTPEKSTASAISGFARSAFKRAKTKHCQDRILEVFQLQQAGRLYSDEAFIGTCPIRNVSQAHYVGCFRDKANAPDLDSSKPIEFPKDNSPARCVEHCFALGLPYAGLQRGIACNCGQRFGRHGALPMSRCDRRCPNNSTQKCGGGTANSVYKTSIGPNNFVSPRWPSNATRKTDRPARIAFVLSLNGRAMRQIGRLLRVIYRPQHYYFIHVDTRLNFLHKKLVEMTQGAPNIYVANGDQRFSTIWGGASLLTMLLSSYQYLLQRPDWEWDFAINLSETDFPIRPIDELATFLGANLKTNFILTHLTKTETFLSKQGMQFTFFECENRMWRLNERSLPRGVRMFGASDWVTLTREFVAFLIEKNSQDNSPFSGLRQFFSYTLLPAESYFHTVLLNTEFCDRVANTNLRVVNWQRSRGCKCQQKAVVDWCGCSPNDIVEKDFPGMEKYGQSQMPPYFFARKFEEVIDQSILNLIEINLLHTLTVNTTGLEYFWLNEFATSLDNSSSKSVVNRRPYYSAFAKMGLGVVADYKKQEAGRSLCQRLDKVDQILSVESFFIRNIFQGFLVDFESEGYWFQVYVGESDQHKRTRLARSQSLDTINNPGLEKLFAGWGYRVARMEVGSDFDLKENVFRSYGPLLSTKQSGVCLALVWEKVAEARSNVTATASTTKASKKDGTTAKGFTAHLIVSVISPDSMEKSCAANAHPADGVTCVCADSFNLKIPGTWRVIVRSADTVGPSLVLGDALEFVVLPADRIDDEANVGYLSPALWSVVDMCWAAKRTGLVSECPDLRNSAKSASFSQPCANKSWSSHAADEKSLPHF